MTSSMSIHLVIIDPQNDFCSPHGSLYVTDAEKDMGRLASMIRRLGPKLDDIHVTLDSHRKIDISHPIWWRSSSGKQPDPLTVITPDDVRAGKWRTYQPGAQKRSLQYLDQLAATKRYPHMIWPEHCLIGDEGHNICKDVAEALHEWEEIEYAQAEFVTKGSNPWTEHFSGVKAEVPDPADPSTQLNIRLIETLEAADIILLAGEALSHCLANTVRDIADRFAQTNPRYIEKLYLLRDATGNVPGCDALGEAFIKDLTAKGMKLTTTTDFLR